jgi:hypothetical protein
LIIIFIIDCFIDYYCQYWLYHCTLDSFYLLPLHYYYWLLTLHYFIDIITLFCHYNYYCHWLAPASCAYFRFRCPFSFATPPFHFIISLLMPLYWLPLRHWLDFILLIILITITNIFISHYWLRHYAIIDYATLAAIGWYWLLRHWLEFRYYYLRYGYSWYFH